MNSICIGRTELLISHDFQQAVYSFDPPPCQWRPHIAHLEVALVFLRRQNESDSRVGVGTVTIVLSPLVPSSPADSGSIGTSLHPDKSIRPQLALSVPYQDPNRAEICIGTDSCHTPPALATTLVESFKDSGYTVEVDRPYSGVIVPAQHYRSDSRVHSIMIEIRRDLYCDESTGADSAGFDRVRGDITRAMMAL